MDIFRIFDSPHISNTIRNTANIILDIFILIFVSIGILTSVGILYSIYNSRYPMSIDTPILLHVGLCLMYHTYLLQSCFPFLSNCFFYKYKRLQNFLDMLQLICIQWLIAFLFILTLLLLHHSQYLPRYHCCPMSGIGSIYFYIIYH